MIKINRNLDDVHYRVKRAGRWEKICFSDLNEMEAMEVLQDKSASYLRTLCWLLALTIKDIGEQFDLVGGYDA